MGDANPGPAYWIQRGVLKAYLDRTYVGDGAGGRVIVLGRDYDYVEVTENGSFGTGGTHLFLARSWSTTEKDLAWRIGTAFNFAGGGNASVVTQWNGFFTDQTQIRLGNNAGALTNVNLVDYRIRAWKYSKITA